MYNDSILSPGPDDRYSGMRSLWIKVIIRAMFDLASYRDSPKLSQKKLAERAYIWLFEPSDLLNGFENVCRFLDLDVEKFRRRALNMTSDDVAKIEFKERGSISDEEERYDSRLNRADEDEDF